MKVCIVGAGASGLMCAGFIAKKGHDVSVFDGNEKAGKKIYITGKGRCNFTNASIGDDFNSNIVNGEKFLYSSLSKWNSFDTISFFEDLGMKSKIERGNRAFPESDKASDVTKALLKHCQGVHFVYNEKVVAIDKKDKFLVITDKGKYTFDAVIIATGGKSYSATGSTGDGYKLARMLGHTIVEPRPALCPIELSDKFIKELQGISLKNVKLIAKYDGKSAEEFGELMFTDRGITGPIVLTISSLINRAKDVSLLLDFKPALDEKTLDNRLLREFEENKNKNISNVISHLLPSGLVEVFLRVCSISSDRKVNSIKIEERSRIIENLKRFKLSFKCLYPIDCAIVTSGGVNTKEINPKNMESKLVKNLYFIGEVLDIDALTGGFNLQLAFATAVSCSNNF